MHGRCISIDGAFHVGELIGECIGVVTGFDDFGFAGGSVCDFCFPGTRVLHDLDKSVLTGNHAAFRLFGVEREHHTCHLSFLIGEKEAGLLYDLSQDASTQAIADAKAFCDGKGIKYIEKNGTTTAEVQMAAEALIAAGVKAVFTPTDNTVMTAELSIYETFIEAGVQHYTGADSFALNGAFVGYGVDYVQLGEATADMVVELLCDGKTPADLPFQTFDNGIATINTETCEALGLDLDTVKKAFAPYCTEVVEVTTAENFG